MKIKYCNNKIVFIILILSVLSAVLWAWKYHSIRNIQTESSFYYWKSNLTLDENDRKFLNEMKVKKIYAKFFDVIWNDAGNGPLVIDQAKISKNAVEQFEIIPVVFIDYGALKNCKEEKFDEFTSTILSNIEDILREYGVKTLKEIQIDCHWTESTKEKYFSLLKIFKNKAKNKYPGIILSATIELHQIKFARAAGIPPVDKGVLLIYHTEYVDYFKSVNSILNIDMAEKYLKYIDKYSLKIDIALPVFSWLVQFDFNKNLIRIINNYAEEDIENNKEFVKIKKDMYKAEEDTFIDEKRIMKNDFIKIEGAEYDQCKEVVDYVKDKTSQKKLSIILFYYDKKNIERFTNGKPEKLYNIFY